MRDLPPPFALTAPLVSSAWRVRAWLRVRAAFAARVSCKVDQSAVRDCECGSAPFGLAVQSDGTAVLTCYALCEARSPCRCSRGQLRGVRAAQCGETPVRACPVLHCGKSVRSVAAAGGCRARIRQRPAATLMRPQKIRARSVTSQVRWRWLHVQCCTLTLRAWPFAQLTAAFVEPLQLALSRGIQVTPERPAYARSRQSRSVRHESEMDVAEAIAAASSIKSPPVQHAQVTFALC
eukprot:1373145-Pleurochrysis_carterae.AAC.3